MGRTVIRDGSPQYPYQKLSSALTAPVAPGQVIYVNGVVTVDDAFLSQLQGTEAAPILVTHAPNTTGTLLLPHGAHVVIGEQAQHIIFDDLTITGYPAQRQSSFTGVHNVPDDIDMGYSLDVYGAHITFRNCRFNNIFQLGAWKATWFQCIECEFLNFGYKGAGNDRWHGHDLYVQNLPGKPEVRFDRCIFGVSGTGFRAYSTGQVENIGIYDCIAAYNNVLLGGNARFSGMSAERNYLWQSALLFGYSNETLNGTMRAVDNYHAGIRFQVVNWEQVDIQRNTFIGLESEGQDVVKRIVSLTASDALPRGVWDRNTYYPLTTALYDVIEQLLTPQLSQWQSFTGFDANSLQRSGYPVENVVRVVPCEYGQRKAHIAVYNWRAFAEVTVDIGLALPQGTYQLRNPFAENETLAVDDPATLTIDMTAWSIDKPRGWTGAWQVWDRRFGVFVLEST